MNLLRYSFFVLLGSMFFACEEGIDPITPKAPGTDQAPPVINVKFPVDGTTIKVLEEVATLDVDFEVTDDIEIGSIQLDVNGDVFATFDEFIDFRRFLGEASYDKVVDGDHKLNISSTDLSGKTSTQTINFSKEPAYIPIYENEIFYLSFDKIYTDLVGLTNPEIAGSPSFSDNTFKGNGSYQGAADSYLAFPSERLTNDEITVSFWMNVNNDPDRAGVFVIGPPDEANPDSPNNRTKGLRFFRENAGGKQRFKLNIGLGESDQWFDGGTSADVNPNTDTWNHFSFSISQTEASVYINGELAKTDEHTGIDWTGCDVLSIMSGAPRFTGWNHRSDQSLMDELRIFNTAMTGAEIKEMFQMEGGSAFVPTYAGEVFYMNFEEGLTNIAVGQEGTTVGDAASISTTSKFGDQSFKGGIDSYLSYPSEGLMSESFSASFWYRVDTTSASRAGILTIGPPDPDSESPNNRTSGFRLFREPAGESNQILKLNVGTGEGESWFDGGASAQIPISDDWVHLAFSIGTTEATFYINGEIAKTDDFVGIDWTGCESFSIGSGAPRFVGWNHLSDPSFFDDLRFFDKAISQEEVNQIYTDGN